jgi:hypothetical protein
VRFVVGAEFGRLARDQGAHGAAIQHETRNKLRAKDARFGHPLQHLA